MTGVTEAYERRLWEELNTLLLEAIPEGALPEGASPEEARRALVVEVMGGDAEIKNLYERVLRLARTEAGYLRKRMGEHNAVSAIRRSLRLPVRVGQGMKGGVAADRSSVASLMPAPSPLGVR